jgi:hypothetical protein
VGLIIGFNSINGGRGHTLPSIRFWTSKAATRKI